MISLRRICTLLLGLGLMLGYPAHADTFTGISITGLGGYGYSSGSKENKGAREALSGTHAGAMLSLGGNLFSTPIFMDAGAGFVRYLDSSPAKGSFFLDFSTRLGLSLDPVLIYGRLGTLVRGGSLFGTKSDKSSTSDRKDDLEKLVERLKDVEISFGTYWGFGVDMKFSQYFFGGIEYLFTSFYSGNLENMGKTMFGWLLSESKDKLNSTPGNVLRLRLGIVF